MVWVNLKHCEVLDGSFPIVRKFFKTRAFKCVVSVASSRCTGNTACKTSTVKVSPITAATLREGANRNAGYGGSIGVKKALQGGMFGRGGGS